MPPTYPGRRENSVEHASHPPREEERITVLNMPPTPREERITVLTMPPTP